MRRIRLMTMLKASMARLINAIGVIETLAEAMLFELIPGTSSNLTLVPK